MKWTYILLFSLFALALQSCGDKKMRGTDERAQVILLTDEGDFRSFDMGQSISEVRNSEQEQLLEEREDFLFYKVNSSKFQKGESLEVEYLFNSAGQLDMTTAYFTVTDTADIEPVLRSLKKFYDKRYGVASEDEWGWYVWEVEHEKDQPGALEVIVNAEKKNRPYGITIDMVKYYTE